MDNYREVDILASKTVGDSGTETVDIKVDEPITELAVHFAVTNDGAVVDNLPPETCISKIEIVDGGQVYWSTTAMEAIAAYVYEADKWPPCFLYELASGGQNVTIPMRFGRFLGDPQFAFSPTKLMNPQLKVTWAKNALHATAGCSLGVSARLMQGVTAPTQSLMVKNVRTFTSAASGIETTDLPVDRDYRRLYVRPYVSTEAMINIVTHYKLDCDVGKLIVFDMSQWDLIEYVERVWPLVTYRRIDAWDNGGTKQGWFGCTKSIAPGARAAGYIVAGQTDEIDYFITRAMLHDGTGATDLAVTLQLLGSCPESTLCYQFGFPDDAASWFKASRYGQVRLELTQGAANASVGVLVQQPRQLP